MLFLISGAAATGKKSVIRILKDKLENFECHDFVRANRYLARVQSEEWPFCMDTLCWAVFHRMHARDPQWEQRVVVDKELPDFGWKRWTSWQKGDER